MARDAELPPDADPEAAPHPSMGETTLAIETTADGRHVAVQRFWLVVVSGPDAGATFTSAKECAAIGTHPSADLVLHDETVSRFHCEIVIAERGAIVRDSGSRNGTTVNGVSVLAAHLTTGSILRIGRTELRFELRSDPVVMPLHEGDRFGRMVGKSVRMRHMFALLQRASQSDSAVLLEGETGTGKELASESIHEASARRAKPFMVVDCSAIPAEMLESELFGHERGAFTGAVGAREGAFEAADGGTIFLDEIGELALALQPKLLRVLEKKTIKRVGSNRHMPVDVRIIAATNRNLRQEVNARRFRSDLYYRLAVLEIRLPPIRERPEDLAVLVSELLQGLGAAGTPEAEELSSVAFTQELAKSAWAGNVRELRNYIERCLVLKARAPLEPSADDGLPAPAFDRPLKLAREIWNRSFERRYIEEILARSSGNVTVAAKSAGVDRMYFYRLLWRHGLR